MNETLNSTGINEPPTFLQGFFQATLLVSVSEIGDRTFFLTAMMAMRYSKIQVFAGALAAEYLMIFLSLLVGIVTSLVPLQIIHYISIILFILAGIVMIYEGITLKDNPNNNNGVDDDDDDGNRNNDNKINAVVDHEDDKDKGRQDLIGTRTGKEIIMKPHDKLQGTNSNNLRFWFKHLSSRYKSYIAVQMFTMVFVAEWADRSQLSIIILTTRQNKFGVIIGAAAAQTFAMALAVIGGSVVAKYVKPKTVIAGLTFIGFAIHTAVVGPISPQ